MLTSTGTEMNQKDLILNPLEAIQLPKWVALCKCAAPTGKNDPISHRNANVDIKTKDAATKDIGDKGGLAAIVRCS